MSLLFSVNRGDTGRPLQPWARRCLSRVITETFGKVNRSASERCCSDSSSNNGCSIAAHCSTLEHTEKRVNTIDRLQVSKNVSYDDGQRNGEAVMFDGYVYQAVDQADRNQVVCKMVQ